jgi:ABC-2 type transport system permease protein
MSETRVLAGVLRHFLVTLQLNFRSPQAIAYGYLMPVFFLLAFGSVFRGGSPLLLDQMGQLLTITILGSAAIGLPTALVAERERGVWRRYRLLPVSTGSLLAGTLLARLMIVASATLLQVALAYWIYGTPLPLHPFEATLGFLVVTFAFLALGLVLAALAPDVPSVQALGQCVFLPMIMVGGVGVPLAVLPAWAQVLSGFMPGRYAVETLQHAISEPEGLRGAGFALLALAVIGAASGVVGLRLFRWDSARQTARGARVGVAFALLSWLAVGVAANLTGRLAPIDAAGEDYTTITESQLAGITYDDLPGDNELATRLAPPFTSAPAIDWGNAYRVRLAGWPPAQDRSPVQAARNLLSVAAIADVSADLKEAEIGRAIFDELKARHPEPELRQILAWIIYHPDDGRAVSAAPELGFRRAVAERITRERSVLYAKKFVGRLLGRIPD